MRKILAGRVYRHFKGKDYKVLVVAQHTETGEQCVVYQALYDDFAYYVRPYAMFASEVDREKYPEVEQQYRFELTEEDYDRLYFKRSFRLGGGRCVGPAGAGKNTLKSEVQPGT